MGQEVLKGDYDMSTGIGNEISTNIKRLLFMALVVGVIIGGLLSFICKADDTDILTRIVINDIKEEENNV